MARALIGAGVDADSTVDVDGSTALSYAFCNQTPRMPQIEMLEILGSFSFSHFSKQDKQGWTALHRAAAYGTAADVRKLLTLGASTGMETNNLKWTPLFCAICFSNRETTDELLAQPNVPIATIKDLRDWTLLHVAVGAGNFDIVPELLKREVDIYALSKATIHHVLAGLLNKCVSPEEVAREFGRDAFSRWTEALHSAGREPEKSIDDIDWTAVTNNNHFGGCECCDGWGDLHKSS